MDAVALGEAMLVLTPERGGSLADADGLHWSVAGAETNLSIGLARLGHSVAWVSRLGADPFGRKILKHVRGEGVDVSGVRLDPDHPTGIYFKELSPLGTARVYYYRHGSAASHMEPADIHLDAYDARYLHITGITPALSAGCCNAVMEAIAQARRLRMQVIFDPNLRLKLWPLETARETVDRIARQTDIVLPGLAEAELLTGLSTPEDIAQHYCDGGAATVVVKLGDEGAYYRSDEDEGYVQAYPVTVVDEIGAGDAFDAGFISGLLDGLTLADSVQRGCMLGALAVTALGDHAALPYRDELDRFAQGMGGTDR